MISVTITHQKKTSRCSKGEISKQFYISNTLGKFLLSEFLDKTVKKNNIIGNCNMYELFRSGCSPASRAIVIGARNVSLSAKLCINDRMFNSSFEECRSLHLHKWVIFQ